MSDWDRAAVFPCRRYRTWDSPAGSKWRSFFTLAPPFNLILLAIFISFYFLRHHISVCCPSSSPLPSSPPDSLATVPSSLPLPQFDPILCVPILSFLPPILSLRSCSSRIDYLCCFLLTLSPVHLRSLATQRRDSSNDLCQVLHCYFTGKAIEDCWKAKLSSRIPQ